MFIDQKRKYIRKLVNCCKSIPMLFYFVLIPNKLKLNINPTYKHKSIQIRSVYVLLEGKGP